MVSLMGMDDLSEGDYLLDSIWDFDFSDELLSMAHSLHYSQTNDDSIIFNASAVSEVKTEPEVAEMLSPKSAVKKRGSRFMKKCSTKAISKPVVTCMGTRLLKPNMSRRTRDTTLYVFPGFDRYDSLLFFAHALAQHLNSGDIPSVAKLFSSYLSKDCLIQSVKASYTGCCSVVRPAIDVPTAIRMCEIHNDLFPDRITCIRSTRIDGNQIKALAFVKYTFCRAIFTSVAGTVKEPIFGSVFGKDWSAQQRRKIEEGDRPEHVKREILNLVDSGCDLEIHARTEYTLTIDARTRKIKALKAVMSTTSIAAVSAPVR